MNESISSVYSLLMSGGEIQGNPELKNILANFKYRKIKFSSKQAGKRGRQKIYYMSEVDVKINMQTIGETL